MLKSKTGIVLAGIYLALVALAALYIVYRINFAPVNSEFCGLPLLLLTLPWSMMIFSWLDPYLSDSLVVTLSVLIFCGLLNAAVIYLTGSGIESLFKIKLK